MDQFRDVVDTLTDRLEKIGLYVQDAKILTDNSELAGQIVGDGDVDVLDFMKDDTKFMIATEMLIGDLAFNQRIADPDGFKEDQEFKSLVDEDALRQQAVLDQMAAWKEELDTSDDEE